MSARYTVTQVITDMFGCARSQAVTDCFRSFVEQYHIDTFTSGEIDLANRKRAIFHAMEWPDRWRNYYFQSGLVEHDPVLAALDQETGSFTWTELRNRRALSSVGTVALNKVYAEGWTDGLVLPLHRSGSRYGLVSLVAYKHTIDRQQKADLTAAGLVFHERMRYHVPRDGFRVPPAGLTPREIDCLKLIATGFSDARAGEALGIRAATVHEHAERAKRKLDAHNRAELVALATALAIIPG
jgi:DNA-binding CsgD family transcriptional regulator